MEARAGSHRLSPLSRRSHPGWDWSPRQLTPWPACRTTSKQNGLYQRAGATKALRRPPRGELPSDDHGTAYFRIRKGDGDLKNARLWLERIKLFAAGGMHPDRAGHTPEVRVYMPLRGPQRPTLPRYVEQTVS